MASIEKHAFIDAIVRRSADGGAPADDRQQSHMPLIASHCARIGADFRSRRDLR
jgi:hypothetical protein